MNNIEQAWQRAIWLLPCWCQYPGGTAVLDCCYPGTYPYAAENHQEKNARALVEKKAATMLLMSS